MAYVLTSLSGNLISAASAGYAPTNSADVSAIASAYAADKQDASAMSAYALSSDVSGVIDTVSSNSASWGGGGGGGVDSATVSAIASSYAESAVSSVSGDYYSTSNPSGFIDSAFVDSALTDFATIVNNNFYRSNNPSSFVTSGDLDSALNDFATIVNRYFYPTSNPSGFIDSAYVDSAVSGKADSSALSSYALSSDVSGVIDTVSSNSASWAGGGVTGNYLTSKVGSGRATFTTAFQDGLDKRPALCINGERGVDTAVYPRMLITDWNRSTGDTHSGSLLANAFEFYTCPTSARGEVDPSGVLLARLDDNKVEFYFDSSVTSKNRSAQYGRGGILLGVSGASGYSIQIVNSEYGAPYIVLDDHSGVTGRIDPSSMNYWNGKLNESATADFYSTSNPSAFIDSAYVDSAVSSKQDTLTFAYNEDSAISSINGSALAGQGGGGSQVQSDWIESSTAEPSYIQNKPAVFGLLAGAGVKITESASAITIATEIPTYDTTTDVGKVLQVTVNGLAWVSLS
jgi:hypothetical protein